MPSISGPGGTRSRPPQLCSDEDLEGDQDAFFREHLADTAEDPVASLSFSKPSSSATSALLKPVEERTVSRRRRPKRTTPMPAFPPQETEIVSGRRFGRRRDDIDTVVAAEDTDFAGRASTHVGGLSDGKVGRSSSGQNAQPNPADGANDTLAEMTPEQIREAQEEVFALLSPDNVEFLRKRGQARPSPRPDSSSLVGDAEFSSMQSSSNAGVPLQLKERQGRAPIRSDAVGFMDPRTLTTSTEVTAGEGAAEKEKQLWMTDANVKLSHQNELDRMLSDAVKELGPLADRRFNLSGEFLSQSEVESLPTHLGLHHHGASPSSAGYTLSEVLLLTRSTVVSQRILSLRMLTALVSLHRDTIVGALLRSGGLALAFASFPSVGFLDSPLSNQIAYLEAVEAFAHGVWTISKDQLVPGLYFASRFYSSVLREEPHPVLDVLAQSGCVLMLVRVAKATAILPDKVDVALRCLNIIRALVKNSAVASRDVLFNDSVIVILQKLAIEAEPLPPLTSLLACDVLSQAVVNVVWAGQRVVAELDKSVFQDTFLRKITAPLNFLLQVGSSQLSQQQSNAVKGAVRFFRCALSFDRGVMAFSTVVQSICLLTREKEEESLEAYLALEAYAHSLYALANKASGDEEGSFVKNQLSELIPIALTGSSTFASGSQHSPPQRAAAGHFAATILALSTIPLDKSVVIRLFNECSSVSTAVQQCPIEKVEDLWEVQALGSVSHAGARLLSRVGLDPAYTKREVASLFKAVKAESCFIAEKFGNTTVPWRPVANACVEWVGSLAKVDCGRETLERGLLLLPFVYDPQVVLDLLSRCLLRVDSLRALKKDLSEKDARKCAEDLLPLTLTELSQRWISSTGEDGQGDITTVQNSQNIVATNELQIASMSMVDLISVWLKHEEERDSALTVALAFHEGCMIPPLDLFWVLLSAPIHDFGVATRIYDAMFKFAEATIQSGVSLIRSGEATNLSAVSTTPSSDFSSSFIAMADALVAQGPASLQVEAEKCTYSLPSLVLTAMWSREVDVSLREILWRKTVEECGGGGLFRNACNLCQDLSVEEGRGEDAREEEFLTRVYGAVGRGLLIGERCPPVLGSVIVSRLAWVIRRENAEGSGWLSGFRNALCKQVLIVESLEDMLSNASSDSVSAKVLGTWLKVQGLVRA